MNEADRKKTPSAEPGRHGRHGDEAEYHIGEVADRAGLSLRTVRYYEEAGLIRPLRRTDGNFRVFSDDALARLSIIKHMKPLGFSLDEMRQLLEARAGLEDDDIDEAAREHFRGVVAMYAAAAREQFVTLMEQLQVAESFLNTLDAEVARHSRD